MLTSAIDLNNFTPKAKLQISGISLRVLVSLAFLVFFLLILKLQINAGTQKLYQAENNLVSQQIVAPPRGLFYDQNGVRLVNNELTYKVLIVTADLVILDPVKLKQTLDDNGIEVDYLADFLARPTQDLVIRSNIDLDTAIDLQTKLAALPVKIVRDNKREYLFPNEYAQIIGYTGSPTVDDLNNGYLSTDQIGKYRLEKTLEEQLKGVKGKTINDAGSIEELQGVPGDNIFLTIDNNWQTTLYRLMKDQINAVGAQYGGMVIVDTANGDINADVSYPSFDSNEFINGISSARYQELLAKPDSPLIDKVIGAPISPGSTYKIVTAYAALQNKLIDSDTTYFSTGCMDLAGYPFCEYGKFYLGQLNVVRALTRSSNIFFCNVALKINNDVGYAKVVEAAQLLGMGKPTGVQLEGEQGGIIADEQSKQEIQGEGGWYQGDICNSVIGQGLTTVTPLQMAMAVSTIYNGGNYYTPTIIDHIADQSGEIVAADFHHLDHKIELSDQTRSLIMEGMYDVAHSAEGTATYYLFNAPGNFRAKTGTVETYLNSGGQLTPKVDGWIIGTFDHAGHTYAYAGMLRYGNASYPVTQIIQRFAYCLDRGFTPSCENI